MLEKRHAATGYGDLRGRVSGEEGHSEVWQHIHYVEGHRKGNANASRKLDE
jgi:hypothetical protein